MLGGVAEATVVSVTIVAANSSDIACLQYGRKESVNEGLSLILAGWLPWGPKFLLMATFVD